MKKFLKSKLIFTLVAVTLVSLPLFSTLISFSTLIPLRTNADSPSWVSSTNPTLTELSQTPQYDVYDTPDDPTTGGYFNTDCTNKIYNTNASTNRTTCMVPTAYGWLGYPGYKSDLLLNGTTVGGDFTSIYSKYGPGAVPNSNTSFVLTSGNIGLSVAVWTHTYTEISPSVNGFDGSITYSYNSNPDFYVKDAAGNIVEADGTTMAFSQNGQWMVYYSPTANAVVRVNLLTRQVLPFASTGGNYNAISDDGQYAATSYLLNSQWYFKVYDLSTCSTNIPATINGPVSCSSIDFTSFLQNSSIQNYHHAYHLRFDGDQNLDFYALYDASNSFYLGTAGNYYTAKYRLLEPNVSPTADGYLAMGDSYVSGEGAGLAPGETSANFTCPRSSNSQCFIPGTDEKLNNCHLSVNSYPYLMARTLSISNFHSVACSGATTDVISLDGSAQYKTKYTDIPDNSLGAWLPGYQPQEKYLDSTSPNVITLSDGGDDIGFSDIVMRCTLHLIGDDCYYYKQDRKALAQRIIDNFGHWVNLYSSIKHKAPVGTKIYVTGYPSVVAPTGSCGPNVISLSSNDKVFANQFVTYLNYVISQAAAWAGVQYVDIQNALVDSQGDHRLCGTSQNIAVNGYTSGEEYVFTIGSESFHPNVYGQRLLKTAVLNGTANFTELMPDKPDFSIPLPSITDTNAPLTNFLNAPDNGQPNVITVYDQTTTVDNSDFIYYLQNAAKVHASGISDGLKPSTTYDVTLHSDPVDLGTVTTDANGDINASVTIPSTVTPGFHQVDITGPNMAGQTVSVQHMVFVAYSTTDYLGTGPNSSKTCLFVPQSGIDANKDGIDDACEGSQDVAAPITTAALSPSPDSNGNYTRTVTASLSATATPGFSVANTNYTIDGGSQQTYSAPFTVSGVGSHTITYWSVDSAGLTEAMNSKTFTIASNIIAQDNFQRPDQTYWGTASDASVWAGDANSTSVFSISGNTGQVVNTGNTSYNAILGTTATNAEVLVTGKLSSFTGLSNIGAVLRFTNGNNWYEAYFNESNLIIQKEVNGKLTVISTTAFAPSANTLYSLRFRISGTSLSAKVWQASSQEPANWTATVTDSSLSSASYTGLRIIAHKATATITAFTATRL